jgi:hypothetical protein
MFDTTTSLTFVTALTGATGYTATDAPAASQLHDVPAQASADMRVAQVELYCDHPATAIGAIRRARKSLQAAQDPSLATELAALEQASFHVRHHDAGAAVAALDVAMARHLM